MPPPRGAGDRVKTVSPERWAQIESLLDLVLDSDPASRPALLDARCQGDPALRAAVEALVEAALAPTAFGLSPEAVARPLMAELAGSEEAIPLPERFGPYRVLRELGSGGMGTVLLAERDDDQFHKQVAIKVLRRGIGRTDLVTRFRHERQILATLDHPGIARLLDGGISADGSPYLVMEYVEGVPLDQVGANRAVSLPERLQLFEQVAAAVQYAHQQLVVHRDLKPSNILVTASGQVKLLDFGIAKLVDESPEAPALTRTGMRVMTPEYAAPEQVRGGRITPATDVYALGMVLYELLVGQRPYSLEGRSLSEVERIICQTDPVRPSAAVTRGAATLPEPARRRLRGDLDTITLKALQKDPARRYPSAAALLEDLQRYHQGRPVLARPDSVAYRAGKFVRRHALALGAGLLAAVLLAAGLVRERALRQRAEAEAATAAAATEFLTGVFGASDPYDPSPDRGSEVTALALLDRGAARLDSALAGNADLRSEMQTVLGRIYGNLGLYDRAAPLLERAVAQRSGHDGGQPVRLVESLWQLGAIYIRQGRYAEAESLLTDAVARGRTLGGSHREQLAAAMDRLATARQQQNKYAEAEPLFVEVLTLRRALHGERHLDVAESLNNLGLLRWFQRDYAAADSLYRQSAAIRTELLGRSHPLTAEVVHNQAQAKQLQGQMDSAEVLFREALEQKRLAFGRAHPSISVNLNNLGFLYRVQGRFEEAEPLFREALAMDLEVFGEQHPYVAASLNNVASVEMDQGRFDAAVATFERALAVNRATRGQEHTAIALNLANIGTVRLREGALPAALPWYQEARAMYARLLGPDHPNTLLVDGNLATIDREQGRLAESEVRWRQVLPALEAGLPGTRAQLGAALVGLGRTLVAEGRAAEADSLLARGLEIAVAQYPGSDARVAEARMARGQALLALGRRAEAEPLLRQAQAALAALRTRQPRLARQADQSVAGLR